ncbi:MAG: PEP-CTERM sorting domain-containing protein [Sphingomonas sp.]|nr:PEP-CTERM sorting domain-containing protein [Sphingomonas sp.]
MSGTGGSTDVNNINLTFDDAASGQTPQSFTPAGALNGGTYQVSNYGAYQFTFYPNLSNFAGYNGTNPNGTWTLFVDDVFPADGGKFAGGWSLDITTLSAAVPEPATWAMMILGFGMVGGALRSTRRRPALAAA